MNAFFLILVKKTVGEGGGGQKNCDKNIICTERLTLRLPCKKRDFITFFMVISFLSHFSHIRACASGV